MSALATEAVCKYCGRTRVDGAVFERWRQTCTLCLRASWLARAVDCRHRARLAADLLTARALYDQAADWEALAGQQD